MDSLLFYLFICFAAITQRVQNEPNFVYHNILAAVNFFAETKRACARNENENCNQCDFFSNEVPYRINVICPRYMSMRNVLFILEKYYQNVPAHSYAFNDKKYIFFANYFFFESSLYRSNENGKWTIFGKLIIHIEL